MLSGSIDCYTDRFQGFKFLDPVALSLTGQELFRELILKFGEEGDSSLVSWIRDSFLSKLSSEEADSFMNKFNSDQKFVFE